MDTRGIGVFIVLSFGLTAVAEFVAWKLGYFGGAGGESQNLLVLAGFLWIPAVSAYIASYVGKPKVSAGRGWPIPVGYSFLLAVGVPIVFLIIYTIIALTGLSAPDWGASELMISLPSAQEVNLTGEIAPSFALGLLFVTALVLGPTVVALVLWGNEYAWRGFLVSRLMVMGRVPAYILSGVAWASWLAMIVGLPAFSGGVGLGEAVRNYVLAVIIAAFLGEIWRRSRNFGLSAIALGAFCTQMWGIWTYLFPNDQPPWAGTSGIVALAVWLVVVLALGIPALRSAKSPTLAAETAPEQG